MIEGKVKRIVRRMEKKVIVDYSFYLDSGVAAILEDTMQEEFNFHIPITQQMLEDIGKALAEDKFEKDYAWDIFLSYPDGHKSTNGIWLSIFIYRCLDKWASESSNDPISWYEFDLHYEDRLEQTDFKW